MPSTGMQKFHAWIFDATGAARDGWLEVRDEGGGELRPADKGWDRMVTLPPDFQSSDVTKVRLWADGADKYVARLDVGDTRRWVILEGLPALLNAMTSLNALVQIGKTRESGGNQDITELD